MSVGWYSPSECDNQDQLALSLCALHCPSGYKIAIGSKLVDYDRRTCELNGNWTYRAVAPTCEGATVFSIVIWWAIWGLGPGARFSKVPKPFRARKAIHKTPTRLFCEAGLFICCKGSKNVNNCKVSCLETPLFWRYKDNYVTRKDSGLSRNRLLFLKSHETFRAYFGCHNSLYIFAMPPL